MSSSQQTLTSERPPSPTMPQGQDQVLAGTSVHQSSSDARQHQQPSHTSNSWSEYSASTPEHARIYHDQNMSSVNNLSDRLSTTALAADKEYDTSDTVSTPLNDHHHTPATEQPLTRPDVQRYDTDNFGDYPSSSPLATPSEELKTSPYVEEHAVRAHTPTTPSEDHDGGLFKDERNIQRFPNVNPYKDDGEMPKNGGREAVTAGSFSSKANHEQPQAHAEGSKQHGTGVMSKLINLVGGGDHHKHGAEKSAEHGHE